MSGIIAAKPFNDVFTATRDNSTMQGFVTAIYEIGTHLHLWVSLMGANPVLQDV